MFKSFQQNSIMKAMLVYVFVLYSMLLLSSCNSEYIFVLRPFVSRSNCFSNNPNIFQIVCCCFFFTPSRFDRLFSHFLVANGLFGLIRIYFPIIQKFHLVDFPFECLHGMPTILPITSITVGISDVHSLALCLSVH